MKTVKTVREFQEVVDECIADFAWIFCKDHPSHKIKIEYLLDLNDFLNKYYLHRKEYLYSKNNAGNEFVSSNECISVPEDWLPFKMSLELKEQLKGIVFDFVYSCGEVQL